MKRSYLVVWASIGVFLSTLLGLSLLFYSVDYVVSTRSHLETVEKDLKRDIKDCHDNNLINYRFLEIEISDLKRKLNATKTR